MTRPTPAAVGAQRDATVAFALGFSVARSLLLALGFIVVIPLLAVL